MSSSSGIKRGLATAAVSALAITGVPFIAGTAHAAPLENQVGGANQVVLFSQFSGNASAENDGQNTTVSLSAGAGSNVDSVTFDYTVNGTDYFQIATVTRNDAGAFEAEWTPPAVLQGTNVTLRARGYATEDGTGAVTDTENRSVQILTPAAGESVELGTTTDGVESGDVKVFQQPYGGANNRSYAYVEGTTSAEAGTVELSALSGSTATGTAQVDAGTFAGSLDVTDYPFENLETGTNEIEIGAKRVSDDAEAFNMVRQQIATIESAAGDTTVAEGGTTSVVLTVLDAEGDPVRGAQVYEEGGGLVGYTDAEGEVTDTNVGSGAHTYYANTTSNTANQESDPETTVTVTEYQPTPGSIDFVSEDGSAFDFDEHSSGDTYIEVRDQEENPLSGVTVQYRWNTPAAADDDSTAWQTATTNNQGRALVAFPEGDPGDYTITYRIPPDAQGNGELAGGSETVQAGEAELVLTPADATAPAGSSTDFTATLELEDGTPLPNRVIDASFARGTEEAPGDGTADAGIVDEEGDIVLSESYVTNGAGQVQITVEDENEENEAAAGSEQGSETGGVLTVETGNTVAGDPAEDESTVDGDAGASDSADVDFVSDASIGNVTLSDYDVVAVDDNGGVPTPGRPVRYTVNVASDGDTSLEGRTVTVELSDPDAILFATDQDGNPIPEGPTAESGDYREAATNTVVTDENGNAEIVVGYERDSGFDDDGRNPLTVTVSSGGESDSDTVMFHSGNDAGGYYNRAGDWVSTQYAEPLHAGSVDISLADQEDQDSTVLPKARTGQSVYFDLVTTDQFANRVKQEVELSDGESPADFYGDWDGWNDEGMSQFENEDAAVQAWSDVATTQEITATWIVDGFTSDEESDVEDDTVSDTSETITWYQLNLEESDYSLDDDTEGQAVKGETVTMTVVAVDQEGQPIQGLFVEFLRNGPGDTTGDVNYDTETDSDGMATYNFTGTDTGTANITAIVRTDENGSQVARLEDRVVFTEGTVVDPDPEVIPINATLRGLNTGWKPDKLKVVTKEPAAAGAKVKLFKINNRGIRVLLEATTLNDNGAARFQVADKNRRKFTQYVAKVLRTEDTGKDRTNRRRVR